MFSSVSYFLNTQNRRLVQPTVSWYVLYNVYYTLSLVYWGNNMK